MSSSLSKPGVARKCTSWVTDDTFFVIEDELPERPESFIRTLDGHDETLRDQTRVDIDEDAVLEREAFETIEEDYVMDWARGGNYGA